MFIISNRKTYLKARVVATIIFTFSVVSAFAMDSVDFPPEFIRYAIPEPQGQIIVVTNINDRADGNCKSIEKLTANPGKDGISLREALMAANNTHGPKTILFSPKIMGQTIVVGESTYNYLPVITGGDLMINGDIDGDNQPDITLDGRLYTTCDKLHNCIMVWSDGNIIAGLRIINFDTAINFPVPEFDKIKTVANNQVVSNDIQSCQRGVFIGPLGLFNPARIHIKLLSDITWRNTLIAGNVINATESINLYAGAGVAGRNRIINTKITGNSITLGGITLVGGDMNSAYLKIPKPIVYSNDNQITDVFITNNILIDTVHTAVKIVAGSDGNQRNLIDKVKIANNYIYNVIDENGIYLIGGDYGEKYEQPTSLNKISNVGIFENYICKARSGIVVYGGGLGFWAKDYGHENSDNIIENIAISRNRITAMNENAILICAGIIRKNNSVSVFRNVIRQFIVSENDIMYRLHPDAVGINVAGGLNEENSILSSNLIDGMQIINNSINGFNNGIWIRGGVGPNTRENKVRIILQGNSVEPIIEDNQNGATENEVEKE